MIYQLTLRVPTLISQSHLDKKEGLQNAPPHFLVQSLIEDNSLDHILEPYPRIP